MKIISIKEKSLPDVDDNFAKLMDPSINDLKELKKQIKKNLELNAKINMIKTFGTVLLIMQ